MNSKKRRTHLIAALLFVLSLSITETSIILAQSSRGTISGEVRDARTQQPVPFANVMVAGTRWGTSSDSLGYFIIRDVAPGSYQVRTTLVGYLPSTVDEVTVITSRVTRISIDLSPTNIEMHGVTVTGGYFQKTAEHAVSYRTLTSNEIRRSAGSAEDIFRVMQSLPGVATAGGKSAQLIVRGGSPDENLTLLDNIEIYNPIHFARTGESMGIISIVNPALLKDVEFMTGGFPAQYGDKLSSVFNMSLAEGNKESHNTDVNGNLGGFGAMVDGPLPGGGTMIVSARRGFFDLLTSLLNRPAAPQYYDLVGKFTYDLNVDHRLSFVGFAYLDQITRTGSIKESGSLSSYPYLARDDYGDALGVNWRALLGPQAFALTTISYSGNGWNTLQGTEIDRSLRGEEIVENSFSMKSTVSYQAVPSLEMKFGVNVSWIDAKQISWKPADTTRTGQIVPASSISYLPEAGRKVSLFFQDTWRPIPIVALTTGVRYDAFSVTQESTIGPRLSLSVDATEALSFNAAYGTFYQTPASYQMAQDPANTSLRSSRAIHAIAGVGFLFGDDTRGTLEVYRKDLRGLVTGSDTSGVLTNAGSGYAEGVEVSVQKKYTSGLVGSISYSYSVAKRRDDDELALYNFEFDRPHILNVLAGFELNDTWQLGVKFQYASGNPYTPVADITLRNGTYVVVDGLRNSVRYPSYHKLDVRLDRTFRFASWTLVAYIDLWNLYNRENILAYTYKVDNAGTMTSTPRYDFGLLPVIGLSAKF
ncbi:MAG: hypothetical protein A3G43_07870 [Ignavibacteria bacterium RIFCSPLOWO2_12_FULL_56_21]|nr:MAG: hypothetical protein A3G43_07870 [Ignavibacteria bacterium RIFCSPLOWO2_12_FULL_56_21]